ncbi:MAG TPA: ATP-grasp ribosomal peptide maturase [bacterium]|nr:ATP-grasp ribosomal peptide maturase [bacterium]
MLLIVTGSDDVTADLVVAELNVLGGRFIRLNTESYPSSAAVELRYSGGTATGLLHTVHGDVPLDSIETVWFRKPNPPSVSPAVVDEQARSFARQECEAMLSGFYRVLARSFWVSSPDVIRRANDKLLQLAAAQEVGFAVPDTLVTTDPQAARRFCVSGGSERIVKPLKSGAVECPDGKLELIYTSVVTQADVSNIDLVAFSPCLFQEYVPKLYEVRVTIIGERIFAVGIDSQASASSKVDWRRNNCQGLRYFELELPDEVAAKCRQFVEWYGLQFSAMDFVVTPKHEYVFLENNPNGQWAWLDLELRNGMTRYMAEFLLSRSRQGRARV